MTMVEDEKVVVAADRLIHIWLWGDYGIYARTFTAVISERAGALRQLRFALLGLESLAEESLLQDHALELHRIRDTFREWEKADG